jgi:uncharacterized protein YqfB (UPF0267 family)
LFVRRLKAGKTYDDFLAAWTPDKGFGLPTRVINAVRIDDPQEILSIGLVDLPPDQIEEFKPKIAAQEAVRHTRIDEVIQETTLHAFYVIKTDADLT